VKKDWTPLGKKGTNHLKMIDGYATVWASTRCQVKVSTASPANRPLEQARTYLASEGHGTPEEQESAALAFQAYCQKELCSERDVVLESARKVLADPNNKAHLKTLQDLTSEKSVTIRRISRFCADRTRTDLAEQIARYCMPQFTAIIRGYVFGKGDYPKGQDPHEFAKDCVGNANLQMWEGLKVLDTPAALHGWLREVARTAYINEIRDIRTRQTEKPTHVAWEVTDEEGHQGPLVDREDMWKRAIAAASPTCNLNYTSKYWADPKNWALDVELQDLFDRGNTIHAQSPNRRDRESAVWLSVKRKNPDYPEAAIAKSRKTTVDDAYHFLNDDTKKVLHIVKKHFKVDLTRYINPSA
jgi:hypothetical protein